VNLVASGIGPASPGKISKKRLSSSTKSRSSRSIKTKKPGTGPKPSKKVPGALTVKKTQSVPKKEIARSKLSASKKGPVSTVQSSGVEKTVIKDDSSQLEEWWKKQSKSMKVATKDKDDKQAKVVAPKKRTSKIDIKRRSAVVPLVSTSTKVRPGPSEPVTRSSVASSAEEVPSEARVHSSETKLSETNGEKMVKETDSSGEGEEISSQGSETETASLGPTDYDGSIGSRGGASTGSINFAFPRYLQRIDTKIRWQWAPPPITPEENNLVVRFDIRKNGNVDKMSVVVEESSGNTFFDQAALRAVYAAHPFPALPDAYTDEKLTVYMHFIVQEAS
jgi:TonB family protein